jgi:hypothetical protein
MLFLPGTVLYLKSLPLLREKIVLSFMTDAGTIDSFVMAVAALRGDVVYTGDVADLQKLCAFFPGVRVLSV